MRKVLGRGTAGNTVLYGLPNLLGLNISGAISIQDPISDQEAGVMDTLGRLTVGVSSDLVSRIARAKSLHDDAGHPWIGRAGEALLPEGLRHIAVATRAAREGFRAPRGDPILPDPSPVEIAYRAMGFTPSRLSSQYEKQHSAELLERQIQDARANWNYRIAKSIRENDRAGFAELRQQMVEHNRAHPENPIRPNQSEIRNYLKRWQNPDAARIKRMPKAARGEMSELLNR
jgi:hypothetical protein